MRKLQTAGVTSRMETRFLHPVRTNGGQITLRAHIVEQRRNLITIDATLTDSDGKLCSTARCTYFAFPPDKAQSDMHFQGCETEE